MASKETDLEVNAEKSISSCLTNRMQYKITT
jgi:hypothetical protein